MKQKAKEQEKEVEKLINLRSNFSRKDKVTGLYSLEMYADIPSSNLALRNLKILEPYPHVKVGIGKRFRVLKERQLHMQLLKEAMIEALCCAVVTGKVDGYPGRVTIKDPLRSLTYSCYQEIIKWYEKGCPDGYVTNEKHEKANTKTEKVC